jgi:hypothetical protein
MKPAFKAEAHLWFRGGRAIRINVVNRASEERQRSLMERAIVGYDEHHPDAPGDQPKFWAPAPVKVAKEVTTVPYWIGGDD